MSKYRFNGGGPRAAKQTNYGMIIFSGDMVETSFDYSQFKPPNDNDSYVEPFQYQRFILPVNVNIIVLREEGSCVTGDTEIFRDHYLRAAYLASIGNDDEAIILLNEIEKKNSPPCPDGACSIEDSINIHIYKGGEDIRNNNLTPFIEQVEGGSPFLIINNTDHNYTNTITSLKVRPFLHPIRNMYDKHNERFKYTGNMTITLKDLVESLSEKGGGTFILYGCRQDVHRLISRRTSLRSGGKKKTKKKRKNNKRSFIKKMSKKKSKRKKSLRRRRR